MESTNMLLNTDKSMNEDSFNLGRAQSSVNDSSRYTPNRKADFSPTSQAYK